MTVLETYKKQVLTVIEAISTDEENQKNLETAAVMIAEATLKDELIYVIGTGGHSNMMTEELFCRSGVLANVNPMVDAVNMIYGTVKTRLLQRHPTYAAGVLDQYNIPKGSILIINNSYGINGLTIEVALEAQRRGLRTIGISSKDHYNNSPVDQPGRHPSKKNINEVVDVCLDNFMPYGDATIKLEGCEPPIGPVSTIACSFVIQLLFARAVEIILERGGKPDIWLSINVPGGDKYSGKLFEKYGKRVKYLL